MRAAVQFHALARHAALEAVRRPVFLLVSLSVLAGIVLLPLLLNYTLGDSARIIRDSALALYFTGGLLLAATAAGESMARELRRGTAAAILAKPVPRHLFFLAKAAGIAFALLLFALAALAATLLAVRAGAGDLRLDWAAEGPALAALLLAPALAGAWNHRTRRPFTSAAFTLLLAFLLLAVVLVLDDELVGVLLQSGADQRTAGLARDAQHAEVARSSRERDLHVRHVLNEDEAFHVRGPIFHVRALGRLAESTVNTIIA